MEVLECDVAIVGGGPAGCTCALYTSRADLKTVILDKNPAVGALAITSHIANYPGVDRSMTGQELLDQMRKQAEDYGTDYRRAQVFMIDIEENEDSQETTKVVYTPDVMVRARSLVLATGAMGRATPPFPGEEEYLGQGVSYCATVSRNDIGISSVSDFDYPTLTSVRFSYSAMVPFTAMPRWLCTEQPWKLLRKPCSLPSLLQLFTGLPPSMSWRQLNIPLWKGTA